MKNRVTFGVQIDTSITLEFEPFREPNGLMTVIFLSYIEGFGLFLRSICPTRVSGLLPVDDITLRHSRLFRFLNILRLASSLIFLDLISFIIHPSTAPLISSLSAAHSSHFLSTFPFPPRPAQCSPLVPLRRLAQPPLPHCSSPLLLFFLFFFFQPSIIFKSWMTLKVIQ